MKKRYFIELSFLGTHYRGWQKQAHATTVQSTVETAIHKISGEHIKVVGAGRTDTGVHARFFVAHFDTDNKLFTDKSNFIYKMNSILPQDIALNNILSVTQEAHARYSALSRTYEYRIHHKKDPFLTDLSWYYSRPLNLEAMNKAANILPDHSDFTSFSKLHSNVKTNTCHIKQAFWKQENHVLVFKIEADRFLRNMVRAIVGTLIGVGNGKIIAADFKRIIESKDRRMALSSAPAQGLSLVDVKYPDHIYL